MPETAFTTTPPMKFFCAIAAAVLGAGVTAACGHVDDYEAAVYDREPVYCYARLGGGVDCYREPFARDQGRLVNYFGPHPSRYEAKPADTRAVGSDGEASDAAGKAPPPVRFWTKDPEPIPRPGATGDLSDRPWLMPDYAPPRPAASSPQANAELISEMHQSLAARIAGQPLSGPGGDGPAGNIPPGNSPAGNVPGKAAPASPPDPFGIEGFPWEAAPERGR